MKQLLQDLNKVEQLAVGNKTSRLLHDPVRYIKTIAFTKLVYPRSHKGLLKKAATFFKTDMDVLLPAAVDIYLTGGKTHDSEIRLARYMIHHVAPGSVFIDIGAHFGYYALLAATLTGKEGKVYAFEAAHNTYQLLKKNTQALHQIQVLHNAVSDEEEMISFYEFPVLYSEYNSMNIEQYKDQRWIQNNQPKKTSVRAVTLDLFTESVFRAPGFIKIDAEGAEDKVIRGSTTLLKQHSPVVMMEFLSSARHNQVHFEAMQLLLSYNYRCYCIDKKGEPLAIDDVAAYFERTQLESDNFIFIKNK